MDGPSRRSLADLRSSLADVPVASRRDVAEDLYAVHDLLAGSRGLLRTLTDQATVPAGRAGLLRGLLAGKVGVAAQELALAAVRGRWSRPRDLMEALEDLADEAVLDVVEQDRRLDAVEDDLFRFARILERSPDLALALSDPSTAAAAKAGLVGRLLEGKADPDATMLARRAVLAGSDLPLDRVLQDLVALAAGRRQQLVAVVESARPLSGAQTERLAAGLISLYGRDVRIQADLDPTLVGGVTVHVDDEIIDGSILRRLADARAALGG